MPRKSQPDKSTHQTPYITNIIVSLVTALIVAFGSMYVANSQEDSSRYATENEMIVALMEQVQVQQGQIKEQQVLINQLQKEIAELRDLKGIDHYAVTHFFENMPFPAWLKIYDEREDEFIMHKINRAFENEWGILNFQYEGKTDSEIWGEEQAALFKENDMIVIKNLKSIIRTEVIEDGVEHTSDESIWIVSKFPVRVQGRSYDAVGGVAIPRNFSELAEDDMTINMSPKIVD